MLLDSDFKARIVDFGLARLKSDDMHLCHDMFSQDLGRSQETRIGNGDDYLNFNGNFQTTIYSKPWPP